MRIMITGGAGFIGSHLVDRLAQNSHYQLVIFDNLSRGSLENIAHHRHNPNVTFIHGDVRRFDEVYEAMRKCQRVYHLAAQTRIMGSITRVDSSFETNVMGTFNVLKAAHLHGVENVVFTSSSEVYGEPRHLPVDENHPLRSKNPYGASKIASEVYCQVFYETYHLPTQILRLSHTYGPRDSERFIPVWIKNALRGKDLDVFGGEQILDLLWIDQAVEALCRIAEKPQIHEPINIGNGKGIPILQVAQRILDLTNSTARLALHPPRIAEVVRYEPRIDRMRTLLEITPLEDPLEPLPGLVALWKDRF